MLGWPRTKKPPAVCENPFSFSNQLPKEAAVSGVAQSGSAPVLGTGGREFESRRPDHSFQRSRNKMLHYAENLSCSVNGGARSRRQAYHKPCAEILREQRLFS